MMIVRQLREEDLDEAMEIYASARAFMKRIGNGTQWKDSWPPREILEQDIKNGNAYAVEEVNHFREVKQMVPYCWRQQNDRERRLKTSRLISLILHFKFCTTSWTNNRIRFAFKQFGKSYI